MVSGPTGLAPRRGPDRASLLGLPLPAGLQGQSLVDASFVARPVPLGTWYPDPLLGMVDGDWKYLRAPKTGAEELYDLARDPSERHNLAGAFPDRHRRAARAHARLGRAPTRAPALVSGARRRLPRTRVRRAEGERSGGGLELVTDRVFNMERRCLRAGRSRRRGPLVLEGQLEPPPRTVGVGLTDARASPRASRCRRASPSATPSPSRSTVDDRFESTSRVRALPASAAPSARVRIEITSADTKERTACAWLSP